MTSSSDLLLIILAVSGCVALFLVIMVFSLRSLFRRGAQVAEQRLRDTLGQPAVLLRDESANFFGLTSRGATQLRGNGVLLLTHEVLAFQPWFREQAIVIPRASITVVKTTRSHLGKTIGRDLLTVEFADGPHDEVAWYVRTLPPWLTALRPS